MKIYFCGSHASGKSTLSRYVSKKYNLPMISEMARMILSERELHIDSLRYDLDSVDDYQLEVFNRQIIEEKKYNSFVSDRSAIDSIAYSAQHARNLNKLLNSVQLMPYLDGLRQTDSFIFFVRPSKATFRADGVRESLSWDGAVAIDGQIKFMLEMWNIRYFQINMDNMQERTRFIDAVLSIQPY